MIWLNPWAWLGLIGIALPVLIHLLGRGHARVHRFPTLRFLDPSRLMPTRRTRVHDAALLAVRAGILASAVAALAQPLFLTAGRKQMLDRGVARAIIVDTSASMRPELDSARATAKALASTAQASIVVEAHDPAGAISGAAAWIARQGRRGEIAIVSDFQRGQIVAGDLTDIPAGVGLTMHRVIPSEARDPGSLRDEPGSLASLGMTAVSLLVADSERVAVEAARTAAATIPVPAPIDTSRAIAIVYRHSPEWTTLLAGMQPTRAVWMSDLIARLAADSIPIERAGEATVAGRSRLVLFATSEPGSLTSAKLIATADGARSLAPPVRELETTTLDDATLRSWERTATDPPRQKHQTDGNAPSDARWLWALALVLSLVELRLRRTPAMGAEPAEAPARAA